MPLSSQRNIPYGTDSRQQLDLYAPTPADHSTVVIFWHGGSWRSGDKNSYHFMGRALAKMGVTVVIPNYRLYPSVTFPAFIEDAALATAWVQHQLKPTKIIPMGHSAGAHIAAVTAFDHRYLVQAGVNLDLIKGFIGMSGPYDFNPRPDLKPSFGTAPSSRWNPVELVTPPALPALLLHGRLDWVVKPYNSRRMADTIRQHGGTAQLHIYPWFEHMGMLIPFLPGLGWVTNMRTQIKSFIDSA
jgi:acetyl esterase/lipase